ncbi:MAG: hypothetical protein H0V82_00815 [Candidatus Protochlamydia sp.]|nr:hypothetical protein [Candidatus Protochlamydia sp.]
MYFPPEHFGVEENNPIETNLIINPENEILGQENIIAQQGQEALRNYSFSYFNPWTWSTTWHRSDSSAQEQADENLGANDFLGQEFMNDEELDRNENELLNLEEHDSSLSENELVLAENELVLPLQAGDEGVERGAQPILNEMIDKDQTVRSKVWDVFNAGAEFFGEGLGLVKTGLGLACHAAQVGAVEIAHQYAGYYQRNLDTKDLIEKAHLRISIAGGGDELIELSNLISKSLVNPFKAAIIKHEEKKDSEFVLGVPQDAYDFSDIAREEELITSLIEINTAQWFANLAELVGNNRDSIPNVDRQPFLASIFSLLSQKVIPQIDFNEFNRVESDFRQHRLEHNQLLHAVFPDFDNKPEKQETIQKWVNGELSEDAAVKELFPELSKLLLEQVLFNEPAMLLSHDLVLAGRWQEMKLLTLSVQNEINRCQQLHALFGPIVDGILTCPLPNKLDDLFFPELGGLKNLSWVKNYLYNKIRDQIATKLLEFYNPMENDANKRQEREQTLKTYLGPQVDIENFIKAPSAFLMGYTANYLQTDPSAIGFIQKGLKELIKPSGSELLDSQMAQEEVLDLMAQESLAGWFLKSIQATLHSEDPYILQAASLIEKGIGNLALALAAEGASLAIPNGLIGGPNDFIKEVLDQAINKFKKIQEGEVVSDEFWKELIKELPLPSVLKNVLVTSLIEQSHSLQQSFADSQASLTEIQAIYQNSLAIVSSYKSGGQLIAISEALIADPFFNWGIESGLNLAESPAVENKLEDLFREFFPGIKMDQNLIDWFKNNMSALGAQEGAANAVSVELLKKGIQGVFLKAMINTIEVNFAGDSESYAAQLFTNIQGAFARALPAFTEEQKAVLKAQLLNQEVIRINLQEIESLHAFIAKPVDEQLMINISAETLQLMKNIHFLYNRTIHSGNNIQNLSAKSQEVFTQLNEASSVLWNEERLSEMRQAIDFRKSVQPALERIKQNNRLSSELGALTVLRTELFEKVPSMNPGDAEKQQKLIADCDRLIFLLRLPKAKHALILEALTLGKTIEQAQNELGHLEHEMAGICDVLSEIQRTSSNSAWERAREWGLQVMDAYGKIDRLTKENTRLTGELDAQLKGELSMFMALAQEFSSLIGLGNKENLQLPEIVEDRIWPYIEQGKLPLARLLFAQLSPVMLPVIDRQMNQQKLIERQGEDFLPRFLETVAKGAVKAIPDFIASYLPLSKSILILAGEANPGQDAVVRLAKSLQAEMVKMGQNLMTPALLKPYLKTYISAEQLDMQSQALFQKIRNEGLSKEKITEFLLAASPQSTQIDKMAHALTGQLAHFFTQLGKTNLTTEKAVQIYEENKGSLLQAEFKAGLIGRLDAEKIIEKMKRILFTPEEMAQLVNEAIPGATQLHTLIAPEIQALLSGTHPAFEGNRMMLEQNIEGILLAAFVQLGEANQGAGILEIIGTKLKSMAVNPAFIMDKTEEEAAQLMINELLTNILGLNENELPGIPPAMQKAAYASIKEQLYVHLSPMLFPIIEKTPAQTKLDQLSGSLMLKNLAAALAKDFFKLAPDVFGSLNPIAQNIFTRLAGRGPNAEELDVLVNEMIELVKNSDEQDITPQLIVKAYISSAQFETGLTEQQIEELIALIEGAFKQEFSPLIEKFASILVTPEEVAGSVKTLLPQMDEPLEHMLAEHLHALTRKDAEASIKLSSFGNEYAEAMLLRFFIRIAEKNPPVDGKDTLIVVTEKLLAAIERLYEEAQTEMTPDDLAQRFNDHLFKEVFGIDSEEAFAGFPESMKATIYNAINTMIKTSALKVHASLQTLEGDQERIVNAKEGLKRFGVDQSGRALAAILSERLANGVMKILPQTLSERGPQGIRNVNIIHRAVEENLDVLARSNLEVARVLLNYTGAPRLKGMLTAKIDEAAAPDAIVEGKAKAAELVDGLILDNLNNVFEKIVNFEDQEGKKFNRKLMSNLITVVGSHLKNYNEAKKIAAEEGRGEFTFADFRQAAGGALHPAVPVKAVSFEQSVAAINHFMRGALDAGKQAQLHAALANLMAQELVGDVVITHKVLMDTIQGIPGVYPFTRVQERDFIKLEVVEGKSIRDLIREEGNAHTVQRKEKVFDTASASLLKLLFPNGKKDLYFIPEELRGAAWKKFRTVGLPSVLAAVTESLLDEVSMKGIIASVLKSAHKGLNEKVVVDLSLPEDNSFDDLDQVSGELVGQLADLLELPSLIKNMLRDSVTGEVSPSIAKSVGAALRKKFNGDFIKETLESSLESALREKSTGGPKMTFEYNAPDVAAAKRLERIRSLDAKIERLAPAVADAAVSNFIESTWKTAQAKFDASIEKAFGKIGSKLKHALDAIFGFVFFEVIGRALSFLANQSGLKEWLRKKFHTYISIDENREKIVNLLAKAPQDQPIDLHSILNEDLAFKLVDSLQDTVRKTIKAREEAAAEEVAG